MVCWLLNLKPLYFLFVDGCYPLYCIVSLNTTFVLIVTYINVSYRLNQWLHNNEKTHFMWTDLLP